MRCAFYVPTSQVRLQFQKMLGMHLSFLQLAQVQQPLQLRHLHQLPSLLQLPCLLKKQQLEQQLHH